MIQVVYNIFIHYLFLLFVKFCVVYNYFSRAFIYVFPSNKVIEPSTDVWFCLCGFDDGEYYQEYYSAITDIKEADASGATIIRKHSSGGAAGAPIYIVKKDSISAPALSYPNLVEDYKVKPKLIFADYTHPDMNDPISLEHIASYCVDGNTLFTPEFVYRYLLHTVEDMEKVPFDELYQIVAMDQDTNVYYLDYGDVIQIKDCKLYLVKGDATTAAPDK
jgi:hypothetical protein